MAGPNDPPDFNAELRFPVRPSASQADLAGFEEARIHPTQEPGIQPSGNDQQFQVDHEGQLNNPPDFSAEHRFPVRPIARRWRHDQQFQVHHGGQLDNPPDFSAEYRFPIRPIASRWNPEVAEPIRAPNLDELFPDSDPDQFASDPPPIPSQNADPGLEEARVHLAQEPGSHLSGYGQQFQPDHAEEPVRIDDPGQPQFNLGPINLQSFLHSHPQSQDTQFAIPSRPLKRKFRGSHLESQEEKGPHPRDESDYNKDRGSPDSSSDEDQDEDHNKPAVYEDKYIYRSVKQPSWQITERRERARRRALQREPRPDSAQHGQSSHGEESSSYPDPNWERPQWGANKRRNTTRVPRRYSPPQEADSQAISYTDGTMVGSDQDLNQSDHQLQVQDGQQIIMDPGLDRTSDFEADPTPQLTITDNSEHQQAGPPRSRRRRFELSAFDLEARETRASNSRRRRRAPPRGHMEYQQLDDGQPRILPGLESGPLIHGQAQAGVQESHGPPARSRRRARRRPRHYQGRESEEDGRNLSGSFDGDQGLPFRIRTPPPSPRRSGIGSTSQLTVDDQRNHDSEISESELQRLLQIEYGRGSETNLSETELERLLQIEYTRSRAEEPNARESLAGTPDFEDSLFNLHEYDRVHAEEYAAKARTDRGRELNESERLGQAIDLARHCRFVDDARHGYSSQGPEFYSSRLSNVQVRGPREPSEAEWIGQSRDLARLSTSVEDLRARQERDHRNRNRPPGAGEDIDVQDYAQDLQRSDRIDSGQAREYSSSLCGFVRPSLDSDARSELEEGEIGSPDPSLDSRQRAPELQEIGLVENFTHNWLDLIVSIKPLTMTDARGRPKSASHVHFNTKDSDGHVAWSVGDMVLRFGVLEQINQRQSLTFRFARLMKLFERTGLTEWYLTSCKRIPEERHPYLRPWMWEEPSLQIHDHLLPVFRPDNVLLRSSRGHEHTCSKLDWCPDDHQRFLAIGDVMLRIGAESLTVGPRSGTVHCCAEMFRFVGGHGVGWVFLGREECWMNASGYDLGSASL